MSKIKVGDKVKLFLHKPFEDYHKETRKVSKVNASTSNDIEFLTYELEDTPGVFVQGEIMRDRFYRIPVEPGTWYFVRC